MTLNTGFDESRLKLLLYMSTLIIMIVRAALCTLQTFTGAMKPCLCSVVGTCVVVDHLLEQRTDISLHSNEVVLKLNSGP